MDINYGKIYSVLSTSEGKTKDDIENILKEFDELENIRSEKEAKEYLESCYGLNSTKTKHYLLNGVISTKETENLFSVTLAWENENIKYCYKK